MSESEDSEASSKGKAVQSSVEREAKCCEKRAPELKNDTCSPFQKVHSNLAQNHSEQTS